MGWNGIDYVRYYVRIREVAKVVSLINDLYL